MALEEGLHVVTVEAPHGTRCEAVVAAAGGAAGALLLHGYSFRYTVWLNPPVAQFLRGLGFSVAAPDMPYGRSTSCGRRTRSLETNLAVADGAVAASGASRLVLVVGASLGARYAAYYAARRPVEALVLSGPAPVREMERMAEAIGEARGRGLRRVLVVVGSRERPGLRAAAERLAQEAGASLVVVEGAGHVVHRDAPERFLEVLRGLLAELGYPVEGGGV